MDTDALFAWSDAQLADKPLVSGEVEPVTTRIYLIAEVMGANSRAVLGFGANRGGSSLPAWDSLGLVTHELKELLWRQSR